MSRTCNLPSLAFLSLITLACGEVPPSAESLSAETTQSHTASLTENVSVQNATTDQGQGGESDPASYGCHPLFGKEGLTLTDMSAYPSYSQRDTWCSVGRGLKVDCYFGRTVVYQTVKDSICWTPKNGSCTDPEATHFVTCNSWVTCRYDCNGNCIPLPC